MKNVEYKAELRDPELARIICRSIEAAHVATLDQTDTYYRVARGRLKKRESIVIDRGTSTPEPVEIIFYERTDRIHAKISAFKVYTEDEARVHFGAAPLPVWLVVRKRREVYEYQGVRIHLDKVEDLGWFLEFEALVTPKQNLFRAREANVELIATFTPALGEAIAGSYSDMIATELETSE